MRVLLTLQPGFGHLNPLVPLAQALEAGGHEVAFATSPGFTSKVEACGFRAFPVGSDEDGEELARLRRLQEQESELTPEERVTFTWTNIFAGSRAERSLPDLVAVAREWQPDLIVRELTEFAGCIAAEHLGLPHAVMQIAAFRPYLNRAVIAPLNRLRETVGLPPDPELDMLYRYLMLSPRLPSFQDPSAPLPPTAHAIRLPIFNSSGQEESPTWLGELPYSSTVYATLGTVFNRLDYIFHAMLEGLRDEPFNLVLTVGPNRDPADFGPQPRHIRIERYIPQTLLMSRCDLVITHGGSGTVMEALSHGLPMVIIPIAADQPPNAQSCARLGVARVIDVHQRTPEAILEATREVLHDVSFRNNARRVQAEMNALPGPDHAVALLEQLAEKQTAIIGPSR